MLTIHLLEKGKDRAKRLNLNPGHSPSMARCGDTSVSATLALQPYLVNCSACNVEMLKEKIKEMGLTKISNNFGHASHVYCEDSEGNLFCIKQRSESTKGIFSCHPNGEVITLIYPR